LNADGTLPVDVNGFPLQAPIWVASIPGSGSRVIKTYVGGALRDFTNANLAPADLGVATNAQRDALVSYIRSLPLGDIFHSNSVIVGSPSRFFEDAGYSEPGGFYEQNKDRAKVVIVGANDGMLHAFDVATGVEQWAFIPNSVLKNLKWIKTTHTYSIDSSPKVADVWFYSDPSDTTKSADEWRTVLVCGLRKGGKTYFALDITDTLNPKYLWEFPHPGDPKIADYNDFLNNILGQSWSEPVIGKVKIENAGNLVERWVAFIGGGFDSSEKIDKDATVGQAFFVVDIKSGEIIWQFSYDKKDAVKKSMTHALPASPTAVDTDFDGYVDKVYIGDLGGQMWAFDLSFNQITKKSDSLWAGKMLFSAPGSKSEKHNIYYQPAVALDKDGTPWVYFGTGDREDPKGFSNQAERFYAVKDDGSGNYQEGDLLDLIGTGKNNFNPVSQKGWYIKLAKAGKQLEKVLAKPAVFNRLVYFTTYTYTETKDLCAVAGVSKDYVVEYVSGGGAFNVNDLSDILTPPSGFVYKRSQDVGSGAPSAPVITVNMKGKASVIIGTTSGQISSGGAFSLTTNREILFWRDVAP
jgi:type IV pilus assembly protein PilY1